ncbi:hypothetical protein P3S68_017172 [Capsicum galapagoense]
MCPKKKLEIQLNCTLGNLPQTCPASYYPSKFTYQNRSSLSTLLPTCLDYFRWIYDDLRPWRETGIADEMLMRATSNAEFWLVIVNGRAYVETYRKSFQSRNTFTLWGILQMLRRYLGKVPDLDMIFTCGDPTVVQPNSINVLRPLLLHLCFITAQMTRVWILLFQIGRSGDGQRLI